MAYLDRDRMIEEEPQMSQHLESLDYITLTGLRVRGHHGVFDFERRDGQDFVVDVSLGLPLRAAAASDDVARTVHYGELAETLSGIVAGEPVNLIETLAQRLADACLADPRVMTATVTVHKPQAPIPQTFTDVSVTVTRRRAATAADGTRVVLSLGANLGDRVASLRFAVARLTEVARAAGGDTLVVSGVYETPPWGDEDQPPYLNAVLMVQAPLSVEQWLAFAQSIEEEAGRVRDPRRRFGPRTLDVDLIAAWTGEGTAILRDESALTLPHPRAHLRAFVLRPWLEIQPFAHLPGHGWVNDLLLAEPLASEVSAMTALPEVRLESGE